MGKVVAVFAMSLDGFIADANDGVQDLYRWLMTRDGDTSITLDGREFKTSAVSAKHYRELLASVGALVTGPRDFDVSRAWGGKSPMNVPTFIVTHTIPQAWAGSDSPFTFVTEGVERAVALGTQTAGEKVQARRLCSRGSEQALWMRSASIWCLSCWARASACSRTWGRSNWSASAQFKPLG